MDISIKNLQELRECPQEVINEQLNTLSLVIEGRQDPVAFIEKILGLTLYDEQKIWIWATTKTQKEKCYRLLQARGIYFSTPEGLITDIDKVYLKTSKHILCTANQIGKTFMTSLKHIWSLFYKIGLRVDAEHLDIAEYKTLNTSPHSDQSHKCFEYVERVLRGELVYYDPNTNSTRVNKLHDLIDGFIVGHNENLGELKFANGAIFYSKSAAQDKATARAGEQFGLITFDECAQSLHLQTEIAMLLSRIIRYGYCLDLVSSPEVEKPSHQAYHRLVKKGMKLQEGWFALTNIGLDMNKYIHPDQKEKAKEEIRSTDIQKYKQMIEGKFVSTGKRFLALEVVSQLFDNGTRWEIKRLEMGVPGRKYLLVADWGMSDTGDASWFFILDYTDFMELNRIYIVHHEKIIGGSPSMQLATLRIIYQNFGGRGKNDGEGNVEWHPVKFIMDSNSMGGVMVKKMLFDLSPIPFDSHGGTKDQMLALLHHVLNFERSYEINKVSGDLIEKNPEFGKVGSYFIEELEEQLGSYQVEDAKLETDAVMALGMGVWYLEKKIPKKPVSTINLNPNKRYNEIMGRH